MSEIGETHRATAAHAALMDDVYRHQRHIYDLTRKFYLLGRDELIRNLAAQPGQSVLELGCGTGRNLALIARRYPACRLFGLDISERMLTSARLSLSESVTQPVRLVRGDASTLDAASQFGEDGFDRIVLSYALSMIPPWQATIVNAIANLRPQGELHIVDFGPRERFPRWFRRALDAWLACFHVTPRTDLDAVVARQAARADRHYTYESLHGGYAQRLIVHGTGF